MEFPVSRAILDSNIFIALYFEGDTLHEQAILVMQEMEDFEIIVPYCVIQEVCTVLSYRFGKSAADTFLQDITEASHVILMNNDLHEEIDFYLQKEQKVSFTDLSLLFLSQKYQAKLFTFDQQLLKLTKKRSSCNC